MKNCKLVSFCACLVTMSLLDAPAQARVTRIEMTPPQVIADGVSFGSSGPYEKIKGRVFFEVDPDEVHNAVVFDLDKTPRNERGLVEFSADMFILKPVDLEKGNHALFYEVNNHGNKQAILVFNDLLSGVETNDPSTLSETGNGFLLRQGYTIAWVGWDIAVQPGGNRLTVQFPIAIENGVPINELILTEFFDGDGAGHAPFSRSLRYESVSTDATEAQAKLRMRPSDSFRPPSPYIPEGELVPPERWSFAACPSGPPGVPSVRDVCVADAFQTNRVYELVYRATKSLVAGLGFVTTRDFVSFLRYEAKDDEGNPNPVLGLNRAICQGNSQSSKYLRDFVYQGFNENEQGQRVCDGVWPHLAGIRKSFLNYRFSETDPGSRVHANRYKPEDAFPRTYAIRVDPLTGVLDGILKRPATDPKLFHSDTANEFWQAWSSLVDTDEDGTVDLEHPPNVRRYFLSSFQHIAVKGAPPDYGAGDQCQQLSNPTNYGALMRPLLEALDLWIRDGVEPPQSRVPRIADGTLVPSDQQSTGFPSIPGVNYNGMFNASGGREFGPRVQRNRGVIDYHPHVVSTHRVLVPKVDNVGNDIAGIRHPVVEVPVATLTGWGLRRPEFTDGDLCEIVGMGIPLPRTRIDALTAGDPRPSLEKLYGDHTGYVIAIANAAINLWAQRLLLLEDVFEIIQEADDSDVLR